MPRLNLPPADTSWLDRALSRDAGFRGWRFTDGYVRCELDGESYAISGRYCGIPDDEEAVALVVDLHCERGLVELDPEDQERASAGEPIPWLEKQVKILCRFPPASERKCYTVRRYTLLTEAEDGTGPGTFARP